MTLIMYDSINLSTLPAGATAYAGYVDGNWPTFSKLKAKFGKPGVHLLSIAVFASGNADCLDVETGDATDAQAPAWVKRRAAAGAARPCVYTSVNNVDALVRTLGGAGIGRSAVRLWSAHYGAGQHICGPATCKLTSHACDGTQWTDAALGRSLDESVLLADFFGPLPPVKAVIPEESMLLKVGAGAITPVAIPVNATHVRLLAQDSATVKLSFHTGSTSTLDLTWAVGSKRLTVPSGIHAALVERMDAGTGDVSLVCE